MLIYAMISINAALVFYTIAVWSEKRQGELKRGHLALFGIGLLFDTIGTTLMSKVAEDGFKLNFHGITGLLAIILMFMHVLWAVVVLFKNNRDAKASFHKFSFAVWVIWLIPFISGAVFGMVK